MGFIKKYDDSSMVDVPIKKWDSSAWVEPEVKKWDGSKWVVLNQQSYTKTWNTTWTQTYRESGTKRTDDRGGKICQGQYASEPWGIMRSLIGFDNGTTIHDELAGAKITDVKLYLKNEHWYYNSGGTVVLGYHNHSTEPDTFSHSNYDQKRQAYSARGQAQWIDMPLRLGEGIRDGNYKGVSVYINSTSMNYYGIFYGNSDGSYQPQLKITYIK